MIDYYILSLLTLSRYPPRHHKTISTSAVHLPTLHCPARCCVVFELELDLELLEQLEQC